MRKCVYQNSQRFNDGEIRNGRMFKTIGFLRIVSHVHIGRLDNRNDCEMKMARKGLTVMPSVRFLSSKSTP